MSMPIVSPPAYPSQPVVARAGAETASPDVLPSASTGMGRDMVRGFALSIMAAVLAALVLVTDRLLLERTVWVMCWPGWCSGRLLLAALLVLSRVSVRLSQAALAWLDQFASTGPGRVPVPVTVKDALNQAPTRTKSHRLGGFLIPERQWLTAHRGSFSSDQAFRRSWMRALVSSSAFGRW